MAVTPKELALDLAYGAIHGLTGGAGPDLLLLHHDFGPNGWTRLHELLASQFRVHSLDMPGFGESPRAEWARHPRDIAAVMLAAARALRLRDYVLVGPGFGGWVAAEMAVAAYPEMQRLVLIAPAGIKPEQSFILDQVLTEPVAYVRAGFSDAAAFETFFPEPASADVKKRLDACRESIARLTWKPYMYSYELPETLRELRLPVSLVWGEQDAVMPIECAGRWHEVLPDCSVRRIANGGHVLDLEQPERIADIVADAALAASARE